MNSNTNAGALIDLGLSHRAQGDIEQARAIFEKIVRQDPEHLGAWVELGTLLTEHFGAYDAAVTALDRALAIAPDDKHALRGRARAEAERGGDALAWYRKLRNAHMNDPEARLDLAGALYQGRDDAGARAELSALTAMRPDWVKGHGAQALLRWQLGECSLFDGFEDALAHDPSNKELWLTCFDALSRAPDYAGMLQCAERAQSVFKGAHFLDRYEAMAASETGDIARADAAFARLGPMNDMKSGDMEMEVALIRHLLRAGRTAEAARLAEVTVTKPGGAVAWSYLGTAWRLLGDKRWDWLEGPPNLVFAADVNVDLAALATVLRRLHTWRCAPIGQSVRSGTQTAGPLFNRPEPEIVRLRRAIEDCVQRYVDQLPPRDPRHPFLGAPRGELGFAGSWSVRLTSAGFHINHTHPQGWISSAMYVALPASIGADETNPAGWLAFGQPPPELGLGLAPARLIEPKPGLLVMFPSTMWHGTVPFDAGERLTVAFDVLSRGV